MQKEEESYNLEEGASSEVLGMHDIRIDVCL